MQDKITTILLKCGTVKMFGEQNKIPFHEEFNSRLKSGNACYYLEQNLFVPQLTIQKCKDYEIQNYDFACRFVSV
jgi:hypothetical protein